MKTEDLKKLIRDVPDFPKKGIIFKDITPLLQNPEAFKFAIDAIAAKYRGKKIDSVVCIESRGFIFGAALSYALDVGLVLVRKKGKLPYKTHAVTYDLEYGTDTLEVHRDSIKPGDKVLIIDDLLATGGTVCAVIGMVEEMKGSIVGIDFVIELEFLKGRGKLKDYAATSLITY